MTKEEKKAYMQEYRKNNKERIKESQALWRSKNPDFNKEWERKNPEKRALLTKKHNNIKRHRNIILKDKCRIFNTTNARPLIKERSEVIRLHAKGRDQLFIKIMTGYPSGFICSVIKKYQSHKQIVDTRKNFL